MITRLDRHVAMPLSHACDLLDILDLLSEILRHTGDDLRHDLAETYPPVTYDWLTETVDHHADELRRATGPQRHPAVTR